MYVCMKIHVNMPTNISPLGYMICKNPKLADLGFQKYETADLCYTLIFFCYSSWKLYPYVMKSVDVFPQILRLAFPAVG